MNHFRQSHIQLVHKVSNKGISYGDIISTLSFIAAVIAILLAWIIARKQLIISQIQILLSDIALGQADISHHLSLLAVADEKIKQEGLSEEKIVKLKNNISIGKQHIAEVTINIEKDIKGIVNLKEKLSKLNEYSI